MLVDFERSDKQIGAGSMLLQACPRAAEQKGRWHIAFWWCLQTLGNSVDRTIFNFCCSGLKRDSRTEDSRQLRKEEPNRIGLWHFRDTGMWIFLHPGHCQKNSAVLRIFYRTEVTLNDSRKISSSASSTSIFWSVRHASSFVSQSTIMPKHSGLKSRKYLPCASGS